jgi:predicted RNA binding protein YcfA (HicA-like mRNA interferase family)
LKKEKLLKKILGSSKNVAFQDVIKLAQSFGFKLDRVSGSHHIFIHEQIPELINLQNTKGQAKPYQLKQLINLIERYDLKMKE